MKFELHNLHIECYFPLVEIRKADEASLRDVLYFLTPRLSNRNWRRAAAPFASKAQSEDISPYLPLSLSLSASGTIEGIGFIGSLFRVREKGDIAFRGERFVHLSISDSDETDAFKE